MIANEQLINWMFKLKLFVMDEMAIEFGYYCT